jgi:hypothetical protein
MSCVRQTSDDLLGRGFGDEKSKQHLQLQEARPRIAVFMYCRCSDDTRRWQPCQYTTGARDSFGLSLRYW